jgi:hypothetical protein
MPKKKEHREIKLILQFCNGDIVFYIMHIKNMIRIVHFFCFRV